MAAQVGLPEAETTNLRLKAIGQMGTIYRNIHGAEHLGLRYGFSREQIKKIVEALAEKNDEGGEYKTPEHCYDYCTDRYLSLEEWVDHCLKV